MKQINFLFLVLAVILISTAVPQTTFANDVEVISSISVSATENLIAVASPMAQNDNWNDNDDNWSENSTEDNWNDNDNDDNWNDNDDNWNDNDDNWNDNDDNWNDNIGGNHSQSSNEGFGSKILNFFSGIISSVIGVILFIIVIILVIIALPFILIAYLIKGRKTKKRGHKANKTQDDYEDEDEDSDEQIPVNHNGNRVSKPTSLTENANKIYKVRVKGQIHGPYTLDQMYGFIKQGRMNPNTEVMKSGGDSWRPAASFSEFSQILGR